MAKQFPADWLAGETVLITGASSGLGAHFAAALASAGAAVVLAARRLDALAQLEQRIRAGGGRAQAVALDVTDPQSVAAAVDEADTALGPLTVLVNNSGIAVSKPALEQSEEDALGVLDVNLVGAWRVAKAVGAKMVQRRAGSIINIASIVGLRVIGNLAPYAASKAGLIHLTKALALEWARHGVRVNAIAPGYYDTEINRTFWDSPGGQALMKRVPMRRLGQPHELEGALLLLASTASSYMTGSVISVDGGHLVNSL